MHQYYKLMVVSLILILVYLLALLGPLNAVNNVISCSAVSSTQTAPMIQEDNRLRQIYSKAPDNTKTRLNVDRHVTVYSKLLPSTDPNITRRGEWQRQRMIEYCQKHDLGHFIANNYFETEHFLYDDKKKLVFCYAPKVGCSKWKYTFLVLNGKINISRKPPEHEALHSLPVNNLGRVPEMERKRRLADYYKYVFVRNPMERILSAYLDKIAKPLNISLIKKRFEEKHKADILKALRRPEFNAWLLKNSTDKIYPTFPEYVQFLNMINLNKANEHFRPIIHLCHPCAVNYNFYGNFKLLPKEADRLIEHFNLNSSYYDSGTYISHTSYSTSDLVSKYFSQLSARQKEALFYSYADELDFYYSLYPEEQDSHLNL